MIYWPVDTNGPNAAPLADAEGDGIVNTMEYALAMVPNVASRFGLPTVVRNGSSINFTFLRAVPDVRYEVQESTDLQTWNTVATNPGTVGTSVTVSRSMPTGLGAKKFLRLKIAVP